MARQSVELGWTNITPCTKVRWDPTSIPGVSTPTVVSAEQRIIAYAEVDTDKMKDELIGAVKDCALAAVAAAGGLGAITGNPAAAAGAFKAAFIACFAAKASDIVVTEVNLHLETKCFF